MAKKKLVKVEADAAADAIATASERQEAVEVRATHTVPSLNATSPPFSKHARFQVYRASVSRATKKRKASSEAEYVRGIMRMRQLTSLATSAGKELAVVSSTSAASLVAAASGTAVSKLEKKLLRYEKHHKITRWQEGQADYADALKVLKEWEVQR